MESRDSISIMRDDVVEITNEFGATLAVPLQFDGERQGATLLINGIYYHLEKIESEMLVSNYQVDADPDYLPQADSKGYCYILAPFAK